jgi:deoxycytidylate deaminase
MCAQPAHAEVNALAFAGEEAIGAVLYLEGHTYACDNCQKNAAAAGIAEIRIEAPPSAG